MDKQTNVRGKWYEPNNVYLIDWFPTLHCTYKYWYTECSRFGIMGQQQTP